MIHHRLNSVADVDAVLLSPDSHLDEDSITAFVEGRLGSSMSQIVLSHLVACKSCRRESAQLIRLEAEIQNVSEAGPAEEAPDRLRAFLENLRSSITPGEDVVFAYQNPPEDEKASDKKQDTPADQSDQEK